ncbi:MAG: prolipoprotein diacylglyceryl transferase [Acidimicrobiia bacterium]
MAGSLASIPSPSSGNVGPFHMYGLLIAVGVLVAAWIAERRWTKMGGDPKDFTDVVFWSVLAGIVGARVYHLFTGYDWDRDGLTGTVAIWRGGLSIWGAIGAGAIVAVVLTRRKHLSGLMMLDAMAPGAVVAQAIGRWGNYFNQELFGRPTSLPWGLEIARRHRPEQYLDSSTFHPTFLYESLWCLTIFVTLLVVAKRFPLHRGQTFWLYVAMYTFGRFWFEALRVDKATKILGGLRFNQLLSAVLCVLAVGLFVRAGRRGEPVEYPGFHPAVPAGDPEADAGAELR